VRLLATFVILLFTVDARPCRATPSGPSSNASTDARKFLCTRIDLLTQPSDFQPDASIDLPDAPEGGGATLYTSGQYARVVGAELGERSRTLFEYLFFKNDLVCARQTVTSIHTIMETAPNEERVAPYVRTDFRIFADGRVVFQSTYRAPDQDDHRAMEADETVKEAKALISHLRGKRRSRTTPTPGK
jgi:hypothetical protein